MPSINIAYSAIVLQMYEIISKNKLSNKSIVDDETDTQLW